MATSSLMQKLKYFNMMTGMSLINDEEKAVILATEAGLLPKKEEAPPCPKCGHKMNANSRKEAKLGWRWICSNRNRGKCPGMVNPVAGTFFEGTKVPVRECMVFIFLFVLEMNFTFIKMNFMSWRKEQKLPEIRDETICDFMSYCREICEVFASHHSTQLGGAGEFVAKKDKFNTINQLENENKIFKRTIVNRRNDQSLIQYMALHYYKRFRLKQFQYPGEKIYQFLQDIKTVYPGYGKNGLELKFINEPTVQSEDIEDLMPPKKAARQDDEMQFIEDGDDMWEYGN
ncbi:uncharacterized protein LOC118183314 [Stegodyphus dumicola]|uniref:uncharacterized protein LOC118183314 n=1 Tax=Stegodyphus dumicola TaxID=202533 RepID=UPI0015A919B8|nr:uncharacterized protein LOC118183314 [Stegodyphus dumicola]